MLWSCRHRRPRGCQAPCYAHQMDDSEHDCQGGERTEQRPSSSSLFMSLPEIDALGKNFHKLRASVKVRSWGERVWKMAFYSGVVKAETQAGSRESLGRRKNMGAVTKERDGIKKCEENYPRARSWLRMVPCPTSVPTSCQEGDGP